MTTETIERKYGDMSVDDLQQRAAELRHDLTDLHEGERGDEYGTRMRALVDEVNILDNHLTLALAGERQAAPAAALAPVAATGIVGVTEGYRSGGELLIDNQSVKNWIDQGCPSLPSMVGSEGEEIGGLRFTLDCGINQFEMPMSGVRAPMLEWGATPGAASAVGANALLPVGQPIAPVARQAKLYLRDLIPVQPTTLAQINYVQELNPATSEAGATAVPEGNTKPDVSDSFTPATAYVTVIAGNVSPSRQLWEDAPLLAAYVNQRLPYKVKFREDAQLLNGPGTAWNIQGIRNMTGVQSQSATAGETAITIGNAIAKVELVDGSATAVVMYPTDAWAMFTKRAAGGSGTFDAGTPFSQVAMTVWGLPVYRTRAATSAEALVADFQRGFLIVDREQVNVRIYEQHSTYAAENKLLVQAEERLGLLGLRPDLAVKAAIG